MKKKISTIMIVSLFAFSVLLGYFNIQTESSDIGNPTVTGWLPIEEISKDVGTEHQWTPVIAVENGKVYVAWEYHEGGYDMDIYYRYFNGAFWGLEQEISVDRFLVDAHFNPNIAVENGKVYLFWTTINRNTIPIYYNVTYRYFDGSLWLPEQWLDTGTGRMHLSKGGHTFAMEDGNVHLGWTDEVVDDYDIYYSYFNGTDWQPPLEISVDDMTEVEWQGGPVIAEEIGKLYVVWANWIGNSDVDVYYRHFDGNIWQPEEKINMDTGTAWQSYPSLAVENGKVYVVWADNRTGDWDIYYRYFDGASWQPEEDISIDVGSEQQSSPSIAVENGKVYVVWSEGNGDSDIYYRYFNGTSWQPKEEIGMGIGPGSQTLPSIAVEKGNVYVVWNDERDGDWDIYYRHFVPPPTPDLYVSTGDIVFDPQSPIENGTSVKINATVHNIGTADAFNVAVRFYDGDPGDPLGTGPGVQIDVDQSILSIPAGENRSAQVLWTATPIGPHDIYVVVDPDNTIEEWDETNNIAYKTIEVSNPDHVPWNSKPPPQQKVSVGKSIQISSQVKNIGKINATVESTIAFYNQSALPFETYTVPPLNASEVSKEYNGTWTAPTTPGTYNVTIKVDYDNDIEELDEDNNTYVIEFNVTDKPITTIRVGTPQYGTTPRYVNSSTQFWFSVIDYSGTGNNTYYYIDTPPWSPYNGPFTVPTEGEHTIYYYSVDNLGGVEDTQEFDIIVDNTPPTTNIDVGDSKYISGDTWVTSDTEFTLNAVDGGLLPVGINYTKYRVWDGTWSDWSIYLNEFTFGANDGMRYVEFYSTDYLGNKEITHNETYIVDNTPPVTTYILQLEDSETEARITLFATDEGSGVNITKYRIDSGDWITYSSTFVINESGWHTIYFWSVDKLENAEKEKNLSVLIEEPETTILPDDGKKETNYKPLIALIFTIILLVVGSIVSYKRPLKIVRGNRWYTWLIIALPFGVAEIIMGVVSLFTGLLSVPPLLGTGMVVDLAIFVIGLIADGYVYKKGKKL